jgi:hypothetical protein
VKVTKTSERTTDLNVEFKVGDLYTFKLTKDSFKGLDQISKESGWHREGMTKGAKAKKNGFAIEMYS